MAIDPCDGDAQSLTLFDGTAAVLRPIRPADAEALRMFHAGLSHTTIQMRFFSRHLELTADEVHRFTHVDGADRQALVVEAGGALVAVARYDRTAVPQAAEVAFVVADAFQHHGLGGLLFAALARRAREAGITTFLAETLAENRAMLGVFHAAGYPVRTSYSFGVVEVTIDISAPPGAGGSG